MQIIEPSVEIIHEHDPLKKIELCGRVCYKSEDKITEDSARRFVAARIKTKHDSILEHVHLTLKSRENPSYKNFCYGFHGSFIIEDENGDTTGNVRAWRNLFVAFCRHTRGFANGVAEPFIKFSEDLFGEFVPVEKRCDMDWYSVAEAADYMTVRFICDRGVSHELVRHRVASFSQESTRYVDCSGNMQVIRPCFDWVKNINGVNYQTWFRAVANSEQYYAYMINNGCKPQEARSVLPNSLKTEVIMTATFEQWQNILALRLDKAAHPQMRQVMRLLVNLPDFPAEITYNKELASE